MFISAQTHGHSRLPLFEQPVCCITCVNKEDSECGSGGTPEPSCFSFPTQRHKALQWQKASATQLKSTMIKADTKLLQGESAKCTNLTATHKVDTIPSCRSSTYSCPVQFYFASWSLPKAGVTAIDLNTLVSSLQTPKKSQQKLKSPSGSMVGSHHGTPVAW